MTHDSDSSIPMAGIDGQSVVCPHGFPMGGYCRLCSHHPKPADDPAQSYCPDPYDGGPAFPQSVDSWYRADGNAPVPSGMTKREVFAAVAMLCFGKDIRHWKDPLASRTVAKRAIAWADAILQELEVK